MGIKDLIKKMAPESLWMKATYIYMILTGSEERFDYKLRMKIFDPNFKLRDKFEEEIAYMKQKDKIMMFPYPFTEKYSGRSIQVFRDPEKELPYVIHKGKRLYYPADMTKEAVADTYAAVILEQDEDSPHRYFSEAYPFNDGDIFLDVGCAEGNMALEIADNAKALVLFEIQERWMPALKATFAPWQDKVIIVNKLAGDEITDSATSIDHELDRINVDGNIYIKIDAEGSERKILKGAENTFAKRNVTCACCTYHRQEDGEELKALFAKMGFRYEFSKGYAIFRAQKDQKYPYFRKGLIRVKNYD